MLVVLIPMLHAYDTINLHTVRSLISGGSFSLTHCLQICVRKEISRPGFLNVNRYSFRNSIDLRRVYLRYLDISPRILGDSVSCSKVTPKKPQSKKNSTESDREFDSLSDTVEFSDLRIFSLCELLWEVSASEFCKGYSKYS